MLWGFVNIVSTNNILDECTLVEFFKYLSVVVTQDWNTKK